MTEAPTGCENNCPLFGVSQKDADGKWTKVRIVSDFRALNMRIQGAEHPLPRIDDYADVLAGAKFYTSLDVKDCYRQFGLHKDSQPWTTFTVKGRKWMWKRGVMGLKNIGAIIDPRYIIKAVS